MRDINIQMQKVEIHRGQNNENLGLNITVINGIDDAKYKMEHIKEKTLSWYGKELEDLYYEIISEKNRVITAVFYFQHKKYKNIQQEVVL